MNPTCFYLLLVSRAVFSDPFPLPGLGDPHGPSDLEVIEPSDTMEYYRQKREELERSGNGGHFMAEWERVKIAEPKGRDEFYGRERTESPVDLDKKYGQGVVDGKILGVGVRRKRNSKELKATTTVDPEEVEPEEVPNDTQETVEDDLADLEIVEPEDVPSMMQKRNKIEIVNKSGKKIRDEIVIDDPNHYQIMDDGACNETTFKYEETTTEEISTLPDYHENYLPVVETRQRKRQVPEEKSSTNSPEDLKEKKNLEMARLSKGKLKLSDEVKELSKNMSQENMAPNSAKEANEFMKIEKEELKDIDETGSLESELRSPEDDPRSYKIIGEDEEEVDVREPGVIRTERRRKRQVNHEGIADKNRKSWNREKRQVSETTGREMKRILKKWYGLKEDQTAGMTADDFDEKRRKILRREFRDVPKDAKDFDASLVAKVKAAYEKRGWDSPLLEKFGNIADDSVTLKDVKADFKGKLMELKLAGKKAYAGDDIAENDIRDEYSLVKEEISSREDAAMQQWELPMPEKREVTITIDALYAFVYLLFNYLFLMIIVFVLLAMVMWGPVKRLMFPPPPCNIEMRCRCNTCRSGSSCRTSSGF